MARRQGYEVGHIASKATPKGKPRPKIGRKVTPRAGALTPTLVPGKTRTSPPSASTKETNMGFMAAPVAKGARKIVSAAKARGRGRGSGSGSPRPIKPRKPGVNASKRAKAVRKARSY